MKSNNEISITKRGVPVKSFLFNLSKKMENGKKSGEKGK